MYREELKYPENAPYTRAKYKQHIMIIILSYLPCIPAAMHGFLSLLFVYIIASILGESGRQPATLLFTLLVKK